MNIEQIKGRLGELFFEEGYKVVFWNDPEKEFEDILEQLDLDNVKIICSDKIGQFHTKVLIELEHPTEKILVYSTSCEPGYENDWLLDIRLYGYQFRADSASMSC